MSMVAAVVAVAVATAAVVAAAPLISSMEKAIHLFPISEPHPYPRHLPRPCPKRIPPPPDEPDERLARRRGGGRGVPLGDLLRAAQQAGCGGGDAEHSGEAKQRGDEGRAKGAAGGSGRGGGHEVRKSLFRPQFA